MKTNNLPFGNMFKRLIISLMVLIGLSVHAFAAAELRIDMLSITDTEMEMSKVEVNGTVYSDGVQSVIVDALTSVILLDQGSQSLKYLGTVDTTAFNADFNSSFSAGVTIHEIAYISNVEDFGWGDYPVTIWDDAQSTNVSFSTLEEFIAYTTNYKSFYWNEADNNGLMFAAGNTVVLVDYNGSILDSNAGTYEIVEGSKNGISYRAIKVYTAYDDMEQWNTAFAEVDGVVNNAGWGEPGKGGVFYLFNETGKNEFITAFNEGMITDSIRFGYEESAFETSFAALIAQDPTAFIAASPLYSLGVEDYNSGDTSCPDGTYWDDMEQMCVDSTYTDTNTTSIGFDETMMPGSYEIFNGTNLDQFYGCAEIGNDGSEIVYLPSGMTVNNTWIINGLGEMEIYNNGDLLQTAILNSVDTSGMNVTCEFATGGSEQRKLAPVYSCLTEHVDDTNDTTEKPPVNIFQTIFRDNGTVENTVFDFYSESFVNDGDEMFDVDPTSGLITIIDPENNSSFELKYIGTSTLGGAGTYEFLFHDIDPMGGEMYGKVSLFGDFNSTVALLEDGNISFDDMFMESSATEFESFVGQSVVALYDIGLIMIEPSDYDSYNDPCDTNMDGMVDATEQEQCSSTEPIGYKVDQMIFGLNQSVIMSTYDFTNSEFISDGNMTFDYDATVSTITMADPEKGRTTTINLESSVDNVHVLCIAETGTDGTFYARFPLLSSSDENVSVETLIATISTLDGSTYGEINADEYKTCLASGADIFDLFNTPLYMIEPDFGDDNYDGTHDDSSYQLGFPYQVLGNVVLPALGSDVHNVSMSAQPVSGYNWGWSEIGTNEGNNTYIMGLEYGEYILRLEIYKDGGYEEYLYDANSTEWVSSQNVHYIAVDEYGNEVPDEFADHHIPDITPVKTDDFNTSSQFEVNMDLASLFASQLSISGSVVVASDFESADYCTNDSMDMNDLRVCEWNMNGVSGYYNWAGSNRVSIELADANTGEHAGWYNVDGDASDNGDGTKTYTFSTRVSSEGNFTIRVNKESFVDGMSNWESFYFNPESGSLIDGFSVNYIESNVVDDWGYTMWIPDTTQTGVLVVDANVNFGAINFADFASKQIRLNGTVTFDDADYVQVELINAQNGQYLGWTEIDTSGGDFNITLPSGEGEYIIRLYKSSGYNWESYYYDVQNSKFVMDQEVNWIETDNGMWMPDATQSGTVVIYDQNGDGEITQDDIYPPIVIDFTDLDSQFYTLEGDVTVPATFTVGDIYDNNDNWIGWNNINFEVLDKTTGNWVGWFEVDRDSNVTTGDLKTYHYKIKLPEAGDYIVNVRYENQSENSYENYYLDFLNNTLVSEMSVMWEESSDMNEWGYYNWVPVFENSMILNDTDKAKVFDVNFVELAALEYKISGTIVVPDDFVPSHDWENMSMIRVEATDANTGMWLGDGHLGEEPVTGTTNEYTYSINLPVAVVDQNITVKLVKEQQSSDNWSREGYFINFGDDNNVSTHTLVNEETVNWIESDTTDQWGYTMWLPDASQTGFITLDAETKINLDIDYVGLLGDYESNKLSFSGTIVLAQAINLGWSGNYWNNIRVEVLDAVSGNWITSNEVDYTDETTDTFNFEVEVATAGNYIVKVVLEIDGMWEEYYVNFGADHIALGDADKLVSGNRVEWIESDVVNEWGYNNWIPNPEQTGFIALSSKVEAYVIDFNSFESSIAKISGSITVEDSFETGDKYDATGMWIGYNNIRVEAISKTTGDWIASTDLVNKTEGTNDYAYELKLGDIAEIGDEIIVKVVKESSSNNKWEYDEFYINFGDDHVYDTGHTLVNGSRVQWIEADTQNQWGYKNWLPNPEDTGWVIIEVGSNPTGVNVDFTTLGQNDIVISGTVTFRSDFDLSAEGSDASISVIDANSGMWVSDAYVENNGSYEINLGDATYASGDYIIQINYWNYDFNDWQNSWWKSKYVDFGANNAINGGDDTVLNDSDVQWVEVEVEGQQWNMWVPDVAPAFIDASVTDFNIDLSVVSGGSIAGAITGIPSGVDYAYMYAVNTATNGSVWIELQEQDNGTYTYSIEEVKAGSYSVEFGYSKDYKYYHYYVKDDNDNTADGVSTVDGQEVRWVESANGMWIPNAEDTTYVEVVNGANPDLNINIAVQNFNNVKVTLTGTENDKYASADMSVPGKSFGRWEQNTTVGTNVGFTFEDIKDGDSYILNFWYENNSYTWDAGINDLVKNAPWNAYDSEGTQVCPKANNDWNCDWENSWEWIWRPDVTPLTVNSDVNLTAALPQEKVVTGSMDLSPDFAGETVYVSIYNNSDWNWADFTLDENGDVNGSIRVDGGTDYRIELWINGLGGYVYTPSGWITQNNSWEEDVTTHNWGPKAETLIDINANLDLGIVDIDSGFSTVTFVLENLDTDASGNVIEDVWVSLESATQGWFGEGNSDWNNYPVVTYDSNITLKVPNSADYKVMAFPMNHRGGYASNGNGSDNDTIDISTKLSWSESDFMNVTGDRVFTITLESAADVGEINGTVVCDENNASADCSGWIDAWSGTDGKGVMVESDGSFTIKGLLPDTYELNYWGNNGITLKKSDVTVVENSSTNVEITKDLTSMLESITGTVTATDLTDVRVVLIETDGTNFEVISDTELDESGNFIFGAMPKASSGYAYVVAAATRTYNADYSSSIKFDNELEVFDASGTVGLPTLNNEDFVTDLIAVANQY